MTFVSWEQFAIELQRVYPRVSRSDILKVIMRLLEVNPQFMLRDIYRAIEDERVRQ